MASDELREGLVIEIPLTYIMRYSYELSRYNFCKHV